MLIMSCVPEIVSITTFVAVTGGAGEVGVREKSEGEDGGIGGSGAPMNMLLETAAEDWNAEEKLARGSVDDRVEVGDTEKRAGHETGGKSGGEGSTNTPTSTKRCGRNITLRPTETQNRMVFSKRPMSRRINLKYNSPSTFLYRSLYFSCCRHSNSEWRLLSHDCSSAGLCPMNCGIRFELRSSWMK